MGFRPKRFDVAGMHPDEAWRAVANIAETVDDLRKQFVGTAHAADVNTLIWKWRESKPRRFANEPDADVQRFLKRGVEIVDAVKERMPLGLSRAQQLVRDRCDEMAKSMQKVLDKRRSSPMTKPL
ncbi:MAG TPA: hypothetical protein VJX73_04630 [Terracidiphilus sp.]|nr:hypothetical protein [Terracidiphilus sp.]